MTTTLEIVRTDSDNHDFVNLVVRLDAELAERDGSEHTFYAQYNTLDKIKRVVLAYRDGTALGCGALKEYSEDTVEVKRMYVPPEGRRKGVASRVLSELESWARELSYEKCILETGKRQPEAIALYRKHGYTQIPNYGQYAGKENSVCFEKNIR